MGDLPAVPEWEPVLGEPTLAPDPDRLAVDVAEYGLQPLRLPARWPPDTRQAMLAATFAKRIGRGVAFSLAAFRQAFAGGRDLGDEGTVLIAAAACEMHPAALLKGMALRSVVEALHGAGVRARDAGVRSLPAIQLESETFCGEDALARATAALAARA